MICRTCGFALFHFDSLENASHQKRIRNWNFFGFPWGLVQVEWIIWNVLERNRKLGNAKGPQTTRNQMHVSHLKMQIFEFYGIWSVRIWWSANLMECEFAKIKEKIRNEIKYWNSYALAKNVDSESFRNPFIRRVNIFSVNWKYIQCVYCVYYVWGKEP